MVASPVRSMFRRMRSCMLLFTTALGLLGSACGDSPSCTELNCDDSNPCTTDSCDAERVACENAELPDETACTVDGGDGLCSAGLCASLSCEGAVCDDANPCTRDACFPGSVNCAHFPLPELTVCMVGAAVGSCHEDACDLNLPPAGEAVVEVLLTGVEVSLVSYQLMCGADVTLFGNLERLGDAWNASLTLPAGPCTALFSAQDQDGETICSANLMFDVEPGKLIPVKVVLLCGV